ncbi:putative pre-mRNA-splicing factor ATP-dependent RNA helicase DEAH5 [Diplonema papillatum]|nr:putative pre-mRNA-splicing factor ATP-dependent RNA helicase DEAH5 [Diplonema papillatum]WGM50045.1 PRP22A [Diplonema papillatum]
MDIFADLQKLSIASKVCSELDNHFGKDDDNRLLADFFIEIIQKCEKFSQVREAVLKDDKDFPVPLIERVYNIVQNMLPVMHTAKESSEKQKDGEEGNGKDKAGKEQRRRRSPSDDDRDRGDKRRKRDRRRRSSTTSSEEKRRPPRKTDEEIIREKIERQKKCRDLEVYVVYEGVVTSVKDFGVFVQLVSVMPQGWVVTNKREGLCHMSSLHLTLKPGEDARNVDAREHFTKGQRVFVKVMAKTEKRLSLDMKEVDQTTGKDLRPRQAANREQIYQKTKEKQEAAGSFFGGKGEQSISGLVYKEETTTSLKKKKTSGTLTGDEQWERTLLQRVGAITGKNVTDDPLYDESHGVLQEIEAEDDIDYEIVVNNKPVAFLKGAAHNRVMVSPVKLTRGPDSSLMKAAESGRMRAKERRDFKDEQQRTEAKQKAAPAANWDDVAPSIPQLTESRKDKPEELSEWKRKAFGDVPSFGKIQTASIQAQRESLPIYALKDKLVAAVKANQCLVVIGETGSGKTTQMTQYLVEAGFCQNNKRIGCTQPRRVAATSVAKRVAEEYGCKLGDDVGYAIRFEDVTSPATKIKYMTDGMLLRESLIDSELKNYSVVMLDEAHERTVNTDVLFGLMKQLVARRKDLYLIVTSATLDAEKFSEYFGSCPILTIPGRTFPVETLFANDDEPDYLDAALICAMQIHVEEPPGDILLFLTGQEEIDTAGEMLHEYTKKLGPKVPELLILPAYASLPSEMQSKIFEPAPRGARKIVIATNIAEASITIDGIYYVIDPGLSKQKRFNPKLGMDSLDVAPISQASAKQRAGRAGRTGPGKCFRLYTESEYLNNMLPMTVPEIQRTNLANTVLTLKAMGIHDLLSFPFMDAPPQETLVMALESLYALGALDEEGLLTRLGRRMAEFPLEPPLSKVLITAVDFGCADDITTIVAMLTVQGVFYRPKEKAQLADQRKAKFHQPEGDHITLLTIFEGWKAAKYSAPWCYDNFLQARSLSRALDVRKQLILILEKYRLPILSAGKNYTCIRKAIASGFFFHAAKRDNTDGYRTVTEDQLVYVHPSSSLFQKKPEWVIYHDLVLTTKEYMREVMAIEPNWLPELAPNFFQVHDPTKLSKRKQNEKIEPLFNKFEAPNEWRLSRQLKIAARLRKA